MTLLANILPGIRDARTPLGVAAIWIVAGALWMPLLDLGGWDRNWLRHVQFLVERGEVRDQAISSFLLLLLAYIAGVITVTIGRILGFVVSLLATLVLVAITPIALMVAILLISRWFGGYFASALWFITRLFFWASLIIGIGLTNRRSALFRAMRFLATELPLTGVASFILRVAKVIKRPFRVAKIGMTILGDSIRKGTTEVADISPVGGYPRRLIAAHFRDAVLSSPGKVDQLISSLPLRFCISIARELRIPYPTSLPIRLPGASASDMRQWLYLAWKWQDTPEETQGVTRAVLQNKIREQLSTSSDLLECLIPFIEIPTRVERVVERQRKAANLTLKANHPAVFEEYDRLETEGEFRCAVALPLTCATFAAIWSVMPPDAAGDYVLLVSIVGSVAVGGLLLVLGSLRLRAKDRLLIRCAEIGLIKIQIPASGAMDLRFRSRMSSGRLRPNTLVAPSKSAYSSKERMG